MEHFFRWSFQELLFKIGGYYASLVRKMGATVALDARTGREGLKAVRDFIAGLQLFGVVFHNASVLPLTVQEAFRVLPAEHFFLFPVLPPCVAVGSSNFHCVDKRLPYSALSFVKTPISVWFVGCFTSLPL